MTLASTLFSVVLLAVSGALMAWHGAAWQRAFASKDLDESELRFAWLQFRRRMQASGMIGLVAIGIFAGQFVQAPLLWVFVWTAIALLVLWIMLLALADALATHQHFRRIRAQHLAEHARDYAELRRRLNPPEE